MKFDIREIEKIIWALKNAGEKNLLNPDDEIIFNVALTTLENLFDEYLFDSDYEITDKWFISTVKAHVRQHVSSRKRRELPLGSWEGKV